MKYRYDYYLGNPETEETFTLECGDGKYIVARDEDWCYNCWLSYRVSVPGKAELSLMMYMSEYDRLRTADSQDYGIAFDEFEEFWYTTMLGHLFKNPGDRIPDNDESLCGDCPDSLADDIKRLYALLEGENRDAETDIREMGGKTGRALDVRKCLSDMNEDFRSFPNRCYWQRLCDAVAYHADDCHRDELPDMDSYDETEYGNTAVNPEESEDRNLFPF